MKQIGFLQKVGILALTAAAAHAAVVQVNDDWIKAGESKTMTKNNIYVLTDMVFVDSGAVLTIEPGTVIKGMPGATALVVAPRGKIMAEGTAAQPIIFTAMGDNPLDSNEQWDKDNYNASQLWGGVILLGRATVNTTTGYKNIEGIPTSETRGIFGGGQNPDDNDNSGVLRYVSIRFGGYVIGVNNEINGVTLGGVGRGTTIEFVEVYCNSDDGFEWFGGTVNARYLVAAFCGDDAFDWDDGYRGRGQFWFSVQSRLGEAGSQYGDKAGEHDGGDNYGATPYAIPIISNATFFGHGANGLLHFRENTGGKYFNSYFRNFESGIIIEKLEAANVEDCIKRMAVGELFIKNSVFWDVGLGSGKNLWYKEGNVCIAQTPQIRDSLVVWNNTISNDSIASFDPYPKPGWRRNRVISGFQVKEPGIDPRPTKWGNLAFQTPYTEPADADSSGFIKTTYFKGAFSPYEQLWLRGWTALDHYGYVERLDTVFLHDPGKPVDVRQVAGIRAPEEAPRINLTANRSAATFTLASAAAVSIRLYSANGRLARTLFTGVKPAGMHEVPLDASGLPKGTYFCRFEAGQRSVTVRLSIFQ